ncbi:28 kDa ribonucleoprotein, chloroplastic [Andrographis paniculata]|uniref:28 kDa ribonucleoprotein, chloroplastic n=1 Tax=Andrographis paniculata TaxID=175694 RepID=UPI0021E76CED|nr:28 kDa ribonucleoprotein, chloroplastic [Andrographis paniculata]
MAATATAVASSFSTLKKCCISSKSCSPNPNDQYPLRVSCSRPSLPPLHHASLSTSHLSLEFAPTTPVTTNRRAYRIAAAVAQEEAAAAAADLDAPAEAEAAEDNGTGPNTKLYFGNLPYNCDSAQLAGIIQDYASPELVEVLYDRETGRSRGFAFVTMSSVEECDVVIENLDGREYGGRTLRVNFSDKPKPKEPLYPETEHKLFVGNLAWSVTSEGLTQAFQEYGKVVGARVLYDGETGRSRGYGFVSYETRAEMEAALEALNGVELEGRAVRVSLAQGKK